MMNQGVLPVYNGRGRLLHSLRAFSPGFSDPEKTVFEPWQGRRNFLLLNLSDYFS